MRERSSTAKELILKTAARLFQRQGYHATGLNQIVQESGAPKGSLYYYFPGGKEALAVAAILWTKDDIEERIRQFLVRYEQPMEAVQALIRAAAEAVSDIESIIPCTLSLLSLEMSLQSEPIRLACKAARDAWGSVFTEKLLTAYSPETAQRLGPLIQSLIDGALIASFTEKDVEPLFRVADEIPFLLGASEREGACDRSHCRY